jgi:hypothetical protein
VNSAKLQYLVSDDRKIGCNHKLEIAMFREIPRFRKLYDVADERKVQKRLDP